MDLRLPPLLIALALLAPGCPSDESGEELFDDSKGPFRLSLLVVDGDSGQPLGGIVTYLLVNNKPKDKGTTGADGRYDFGYLAPGPYAVAAGLRRRGFIHAAERVDLEKDTEVTLTIRKHEGLRFRVEMPPGEPLPEVVKVIYRKEGRDRGPMTNVKLDTTGAGHTWSVFPGSYRMTFIVPGYRPVEREVQLRHLGNEPVEVRFEPL